MLMLSNLGLRKHILLVLGTRPEAIKMAPLYKSLDNQGDQFRTTLCVTGQHREMLDSVLNIFDITPKYDLDLMTKSQGLASVTSGVLMGIDNVLDEEQPDVVLVHGDTTTAMASAMASFYRGITLGHVEAGLRTNNIRSPFPEEFNRQLISRIAQLHFAPTDKARLNLLKEHTPDDQIFVTGNTVIDALQLTLNKIALEKKLESQITSFINSSLSFDWKNEKFVLVTGHRRENFGKGFEEICIALAKLSHIHPNIHFVYPVHLNPNVQKPVFANLSDIDNIHLIEPLDYQPFVYLLSRCYFVLTDSGGIQEEAPSLGKPVLVMRDITERPEAVEFGTVRIIGTHCNNIIQNVNNLIENKEAFLSMSKATNPYGDGKSCARIVEILGNFNLEK